MRPAFRTGQIIATADVLAVIDRSTLIRAIIAHATRQPDYDGQPIRTTCGRILLETPSSRDKTIISLRNPWTL